MPDAKSKVVLEDVELVSNSPDARRPKRWGVVSALPSEYLVVYRKGRLREQVSGQGGRCFKWPGDTVAIVPTTLKEVLFQANQITVDNVDVRLRGMVLYRVADPACIYKLINFTNRQQAEAKLGRMIADMCRSNAKWLVANMTVEECIRRRKEEIALALKAEVARVVTSGEQGNWGVEIQTVDIQDVFIQDEDVFRALQAKFKAEREAEATLAQLGMRHEVKRREIAAERELEEDRQRLALEKARLAAELELAGIAQMRRNEDEKFKLDRFRVEQNGQISLDRMRRENEREREQSDGRRERASIESEAKRIANTQEIEAIRERLAAENTAGSASLQKLFVTEALPLVAQALAQQSAHMRFTVFQSGAGSGQASPFQYLLGQLLELMERKLERVPVANAEEERGEVP